MTSRVRSKSSQNRLPGGDPLWYKDAVIYEAHVRAFHDSSGDGTGDFRGLTEKLDYLQDLGITALWLLPFYPSPWKDDGYDIADYMGVHPAYGTLRDFQSFLREAHRLGIRVITELVINHTSDEHPWFQRARRAPAGSNERDFYVWSDSPDRYADARVIFSDFEASNWRWDPAAHAYFWHRFYSHQPDLNFDNPAVQRAIFRVADFWLGMGVDGLRLDAVPYLYEREGTGCENLPETFEFLRSLRRHVDRKFQGRMLLAEANQWPEDAVQYFGAGDECHMAFHFPLMPRLFMAIGMENRYPITEILDQTPAIPEGCQWAIFLRNHDELTLEMVTDSERDYMYRAYARDAKARVNLGIRRRLAPLLGNNRRRMELMNALLFAMPGTPIVYYGDEIGMGDNIFLGDRNGVRTPMQWSPDRNAGFSPANPQRLYLPIITDPEYHYEAVNVETQQANPTSLLWWMKRLIALRKRFHVFGRGTIEFLNPQNRKVMAFLRRYQDECMLVVANLSRFCQPLELDLSAFHDQVPVELFGMTPFRPIGAEPYVLTLGPHSFFWFQLRPAQAGELVLEGPPAKPTAAALSVSSDWLELFPSEDADELARVLIPFVKRARWFAGKARRMQGITILEMVPVRDDGTDVRLLLLRVDYNEGESEMYSLALTFAEGRRAVEIETASPEAVVSRVQVHDTGAIGVLYDATRDPGFGQALLDGIVRRRKWKGQHGQVAASRTAELRERMKGVEGDLHSAVLKAEQSNTSLVYSDSVGGRLLFKCLRRLEPGVNPDLEVGRWLASNHSPVNTPPLVGALEYCRPDEEPITLGILHGFIANEGDAWGLTVDSVTACFERAVIRAAEWRNLPARTMDVASLLTREPTPLAAELIGHYVDQARLLGQRVGELHGALAHTESNPAFCPESYTAFHRQALSRMVSNEISQSLRLLNQQLSRIPADDRKRAEVLLARESEIRQSVRSLRQCRSAGRRMRIHGDLHLGQVLFTGKDFYITDFEGEPARSLGERRTKASPLYDIAGMFRSFHYACATALRGGRTGLAAREEDRPVLAEAADRWQSWVSGIFLRAYLNVVSALPIVPSTPADLQVMLYVHLLQKAAYELRYELNNRPDWVGIPIAGMLQVLSGLQPDAAGAGAGAADKTSK